MDTLLIFPNAEAVCQFVAQEFSRLAGESHAAKQTFRVALSGGSTPQRLFSILASTPYKSTIPWSIVELFWGDERCVPPDNLESNYFQAHQALIRAVPIPPTNIHRIKGELDPSQAVLEYTRLLTRLAAPRSAFPSFDLVLLGMGADGHTASLFPGSDPVMPEPVWAVTAFYQDRPANRITLTPQVFNAAKNTLILVSGESKAQALAAAFQGEVDLIRLPIQRIQPLNGKKTWLVDEAAAQSLKK